MKHIAGAILIVGLAGVSCSAYINSGGRIGMGWAILAFMSWLFWDFKDDC